jgi:hypothetical protein
LKIIIVNKKRTWKLRKKNESLSFFFSMQNRVRKVMWHWN